jgi:AraC-like DNA-binding protein
MPELVRPCPSARDATPMVVGGEALRLKQFLLDHQLHAPRLFHRIVRAPAGANKPNAWPCTDALDATDVSQQRVPERLLVDALGQAMRTLRRPSLPIDFGASIRPADMGIYGMLILTARTLGDALARSVQFQRLMTTTARLGLETTPGGVSWVWGCHQPRSLGVRIRNEVALTEHITIVRALVAGAVPRQVSFVHSRPPDSSSHARFYGCPVVWAAPADSVEWSAQTLSRPLGIDPALGAFVQREAMRRLALLPAAGSLDEVKHAILCRLPSGDANLPTIAAALGRAPRSLRRELAHAGCAFRALVDGVRQQRAAEMAAEGIHSMTEIALKLGFSEVSAFSRAWRRWFSRPFRTSTNRL